MNIRYPIYEGVYRHVLHRNEFQENDASLYDFCGHYRINDLYAKFVRNP